VAPVARRSAGLGSRVLSLPGGDDRWHPGARDADGVVRRSRIRDLSPGWEPRHGPVEPRNGCRETLQPPADGSLRVPSDRGGHPELSFGHQSGIQPVRGRAGLARRPREGTRLHRTDGAEENQDRRTEAETRRRRSPRGGGRPALAPASVAGSEGREGDRNPHGAREVAATEEEHRIRVGADPSLETRYRNRNRHAGRSAESDRRQATVHRSEEGSSEVVTFIESRMGPAIFRNRQNAHLAFPLPRPKSGGGMIPGHTREGVLTEATNDYAGPILPGLRETAWIQKSPYFHRAAKHGVRPYDLYNHMLMPGLYTDPV